MILLNDLKSLLVSSNVLSEDNILFNFDEAVSPADRLILLLKGGTSNDLAKNSDVTVLAKSLSMQTADSLINSAFATLAPDKNFQKTVSVNQNIMLIKAVSPPYYKEKEKNGTHVFAFDLRIIHKN